MQGLLREDFKNKQKNRFGDIVPKGGEGSDRVGGLSQPLFWKEVKPPKAVSQPLNQ